MCVSEGGQHATEILLAGCVQSDHSENAVETLVVVGTAQVAEEDPVKIKEQTIAGIFGLCSADFSLPDRHHTSVARAQVVCARWTMASACHTRHFLLEHHGDARAIGQDSNRHVAPHIIVVSYHATILPTIHAHSGLLDMVLCMQVSVGLSNAFSRKQH